jgi:hypothetical protein
VRRWWTAEAELLVIGCRKVKKMNVKSIKIVRYEALWAGEGARLLEGFLDES